MKTSYRQVIINIAVEQLIRAFFNIDSNLFESFFIFIILVAMFVIIIDGMMIFWSFYLQKRNDRKIMSDNEFTLLGEFGLCK